MKSIALISLLATGALAQSSTSSNPLIPSGISSGCSSFLTTLNSNSTLSSCLAPLVSATADFGPSSNATGSPSASTISTALNNVCGSSTSCDESTIRSQLASFYSACSAELTSSSNQDVIRTYDVLYALTPLKTAICAKDDSGRYCVTTLSDIVSSNATSVRVSTGSSSSSKSSIADSLWTSISSKSVSRRAETAQVALIPNVTTYRESNILFLFLDGALSSSKLCTTCTRSVVTAYLTFEASVPYAPGIANSVLLAGQSDLYSGIQSTCGSSFLQGSVQAAGGSISSGLVGAAPRSLDGKVAMAGAMLGSLFAGAVAVL